MATLAAPDAAQVIGDLKVDGIHFSVDSSVQTKASPWGYGAPNGVDIGYLQGNVGLGTLTPSVRLDVVGDAAVSGTLTAGNVTATNLVAKTGATMTGPLNLPSNGFMVGANQIVASNGFIGIGTASPTVPLDVVGDVHISGLLTAVYMQGINLFGDEKISGDINFVNPAICRWDMFGPSIQPQANGSLSFSVPNVINGNCSGYSYQPKFPVLTVANIGNSPGVGIGTTSPKRPLHIVGGTPEISLEYANGTANNRVWNLAVEGGALPNLDIRVLNDAHSAATRQVLSLKNNGNAVFSGDLSAANAAFTGSLSAVNAVLSGNLTANNGVTGTRTTGESIAVYGINTSTDAPTVEGWNTGSGDIFRGWSGAYPGHTLKFRVYNNGAVWALNGYSQGSDLRLKTDIQPLENALDKVLRLRGVSYLMKADETRSRRIGVIAQELDLEYPELVMIDDEGMKSVAYANLAPVLIEAVKALKVENDALKAGLAAQNERQERLEKLFAAARAD
jgi:hypothetical protein